MKTLVLTLTLAATAFAADPLDLSSLDKLASKARESANVTLDQEKLRLAAGFMGDDKDDQAMRTTISNLKGIFVRSFEFDSTGAYSQADLEPIRRQLKSAAWSKVVDVKEKDETAEIYFNIENGQMNGIAVLAAEPKEVTVVHISGKIDPKMMQQLGGKFGIPNVPGSLMGGSRATPKPPKAPKPPAHEDEE